MDNEKVYTHIMITSGNLPEFPWFIDVTEEQKKMLYWLKQNNLLREECEVFNLSNNSVYETIS